MVMVAGNGQVKQVLQQDMYLRGLKQICAAHHMGDGLRRVIHDHGQMLRRAHVASGQNDVSNLIA